MNDETTKRIENTVRHVVELLVAGQYHDIEALTDGVRLKKNEIEAGVLEYGRRLVAPPDGSYKLIDVVPITKTSPPEYSIRFRLYTEEEGRSDLEIQATLIDAKDTSFMKVEFDNILVA